MDLRGKKINFLGDSITEGVGTACAEEIYLNRIKKTEQLAEARNYGISGTRLAVQNGPEDWGPAYSVRYTEMDDDADIVVVFGGTNDFGHGNAPIGEFSDRVNTTYYGACHVLMQGLIEKYPAALIVFMTPLHRLSEDEPSMGNGLPLKRYVEIIREVAEYYAIPVLDLYSVSGIQPRVGVIQQKYCPDGLHPNGEGHKLIAARLTGFLKSL
ncbi:MAG: SGNH/GDSL hydrolase family protein [Clostridia bacterium]|nr:SGNH/GDSL hydrolase family protein [Clostridia bacterium]